MPCGVSDFTFVCPFTKYLKSYRTINLILFANFPYGAGKKPFDFENNRSGVRMSAFVRKFRPNNNRQENWDAIAAKRWEIDMWLLLGTNRKSYVGSPTVPLDLISSDLEGQVLVHSNFEGLYDISERSRVRPYVTIKHLQETVYGCSTGKWHSRIWPWVTLKGQSQGHSDFEVFVS